ELGVRRLPKERNIAAQARDEPENDRNIHDAEDQPGEDAPAEALDKLVKPEAQPPCDLAVAEGPDREPEIGQGLGEKQDRGLALESGGQRIVEASHDEGR